MIGSVRRRSRHRAGHLAVLLLALLLLIDAAMSLCPGAFRLQATGGIEVAAAPANESASAASSPLRVTPRLARSTALIVAASSAPAPLRRVLVADRPPAPRLAYLAEPASAQSPDDD